MKSNKEKWMLSINVSNGFSRGIIDVLVSIAPLPSAKYPFLSIYSTATYLPQDKCGRASKVLIPGYAKVQFKSLGWLDLGRGTRQATTF